MAVAGHAGELALGHCETIPVACMIGRTHLYEGTPIDTLRVPIRAMRLLGCETVVLTNAAGGLKATLPPGRLMIVADHINMMGVNPLVGSNDDAFGPRFPPLEGLYDESLRALDFMVKTRLFISQIVLQIVLGTLVPIALLAAVQVVRVGERARRRIYAASAALTLVGILAMRWNVVIGGQLFSKSFLGYTTYKMGFATREGLLPAILIMLLPFAILAVLIRLLPPWAEEADKPVKA